jgi:hypothetical protein
MMRQSLRIRQPCGGARTWWRCVVAPSSLADGVMNLDSQREEARLFSITVTFTLTRTAQATPMTPRQATNDDEIGLFGGLGPARRYRQTGVGAEAKDVARCTGS